MSRILVTGAAGFIGSHICQELLKKPGKNKVIGIDNLSGGCEENIPVGVVFYNIDIRNQSAMDSIVEANKIDYIIHAAAYAAEGLSHFIRRYNYETNVIGSINLINAAVKNKVKGFVFLSSIATYGHQVPPFKESTPLAPADPYGIAKMAVELDLAAAREMFGLPYVVFRPFNVYGERQNIGDAYRNVVGIFMNQCLQGNPMTIFGDGQQTRAFSYISDVAPAIAASIDMPECWGETFNIGGTQPHSVWHLASVIADCMAVRHQIKYLPPRKEVVHAFCDTTRARKVFKDVLKDVRLEDGLARMASWVRRHGARSTKKFTNIELTQNLPENWTKL